VGPENETFLGPEMAMSVAGAIWAQKSRDPSIQIHTSSPIKTTGILVFSGQETRDFRAHSQMVYNKRVRSLRGIIKGVEGWGGGGTGAL
jgi:hypothetical protein